MTSKASIFKLMSRTLLFAYDLYLFSIYGAISGIYKSFRSFTNVMKNSNMIYLSGGLWGFEI